MDKQYIGLTDPGEIINALCDRLRDVTGQLEYQRDANATLIGENAVLRKEVEKLQQSSHKKPLDTRDASKSQNHDDYCYDHHPNCPCLTCAKSGNGCCITHNRINCGSNDPCPDYTPEAPHDPLP